MSSQMGVDPAEINKIIWISIESSKTRCQNKLFFEGGTFSFRVHEGVNIVSDFLLKVGGDSASCSIGEIIPFQELCDVWPVSSK